MMMNRAGIIQEIERLEEAVKKLRTDYEKYFAGIERIPPARNRDELKRDLRRLITSGNHNTAVRFRINSLQATMVTYENYWDRITRRIEEGTFHRDQFRMKRKAEIAGEDGEPARADDAPAQPAAAAAAAAQPPASNGEFPDSLRKLHDAFNKARQQSGDGRPVSIEALAATVKKQMTAIKQKYNCKRVEFKVTVKDGKAILKAIPK